MTQIVTLLSHFEQGSVPSLAGFKIYYCFYNIADFYFSNPDGFLTDFGENSVPINTNI